MNLLIKSWAMFMISPMFDDDIREKLTMKCGETL